MEKASPAGGDGTFDSRLNKRGPGAFHGSGSLLRSGWAAPRMAFGGGSSLCTGGSVLQLAALWLAALKD